MEITQSWPTGCWPDPPRLQHLQPPDRRQVLRLPADRDRRDGLVRAAGLLALLPGWERLRGACAEVALAGELGIPCFPLRDVILGESG